MWQLTDVPPEWPSGRRGAMSMSMAMEWGKTGAEVAIEDGEGHLRDFAPGMGEFDLTLGVADGVLASSSDRRRAVIAGGSTRSRSCRYHMCNPGTRTRGIAWPRRTWPRRAGVLGKRCVFPGTSGRRPSRKWASAPAVRPWGWHGARIPRRRRVPSAGDVAAGGTFGSNILRVESSRSTSLAGGRTRSGPDSGRILVNQMMATLSPPPAAAEPCIRPAGSASGGG